MDYIDLAYAERPPEGLQIEEIVHDIGALIDAGKLRAWGVLNWGADLIAEAATSASAQGVAPPCAAQLAYNLVHRTDVEGEDMAAALDASGANVVASFTLFGGALTGKYAEPGAKGRLSEHPDEAERYRPAIDAAGELRSLAERRQASPASMAIAFALLNPRVASVLFGATSPEQVVENVSAARLASDMNEPTIAELRRIGVQS